MEDDNECDYFISFNVLNKWNIIVKYSFRIVCVFFKVNFYKIKIKGKILIINGRIMFLKFYRFDI